MGLFSGIGNLFSGERSLFRGAASLFRGDRGAQPGEPNLLFNGAPSTSRPPGDELFEGHGLPTPPAALTADGLAHVYTFQSLWNTANKSYNWRWDEAYRRSRQDAIAMRRDCFLQGLLKERQYPTAQMSWHLEPENKADPAQMKVCDQLATYIQSMPDLEDIHMALLDGIWYGRAGVQWVWDWKQVRGRRTLLPREWYPVNGDKIQFTWDGIPEIMIYAGQSERIQAAGCDVRMTDRGMVAVLTNPVWRERFVLYKHDRIDADFFESEMNGGVHGVGVRHWVYWNDWLKKEIAGYLMDFLQRFGQGFNVYYYDPGNPDAEEEAIKIAKTQGKRTWVVWPRVPGESGAVKGVEHIEAGTGGAEVITGLMKYFDDKTERFIIGQLMSGGSDNENGLGGSGKSKLARNTKQNIIRSDCKRLAGVMTRDFVAVLQKYNHPEAKFPIQWVFDIDSDDPKAKLDSVKAAWEMGVSFDEDEVRALTGCKKPAADATVLKNPQLAGQEGQPGGEPDGQGVFQGGGTGGTRAQAPGVFQGQPAGGDGASLFEGRPTAVAASKEGPPQRYESQERPTVSEPSTIYLAAYRGDHQPPTMLPLGTPDEVRTLFAWCRTLDAYPEVQQFAIDASTNPHGGREDVERFAGQLRQALGLLDTEAEEASNPTTQLLLRIGPRVLALVRDAEGLVVTEGPTS